MSIVNLEIANAANPKRAKKHSKPKKPKYEAIEPIVIQPVISETKPKTMGVLLIAAGHPYYGQMAVNLAMTLKASGACNITLCWHGDALNHFDSERRNLFDSIKKIPDEYITDNGKFTPFKSKLFIDKLSDYDHTLYLDVDMAWFMKHNIAAVMRSMLNIPFAVETRGSVVEIGSSESYLWADLHELKQIASGKIHGIHSEFIWFDRSDVKVNELFNCARELYSDSKKVSKEFAGEIPDELPLALAMNRLGIEPHKSEFIPAYWHLLDFKKGTSIEYAMNNHYAYSVGGNATPAMVIDRYNRIVKAAAMHFKISNIWRLKPKRQWLPQRRKM